MIKTLSLVVVLSLASAGCFGAEREAYKAPTPTGPVGEILNLKTESARLILEATTAFLSTVKVPKFKSDAGDRSKLERLEDMAGAVRSKQATPETIMNYADALVNPVAFPLDFWDRFNRGKCITGY